MDPIACFEVTVGFPQWADRIGRAQRHTGQGLRLLLHDQGVGRGVSSSK